MYSHQTNLPRWRFNLFEWAYASMTSKNRLLCHSGLSIFKKILFFSKMLCFLLMLWSSSRIAAESFQSCLTQCDLMDCSLPGCPWDSLGKGTGVCCHALLQGIFPTQASNPSLLILLHWKVGSLPQAPPGKPNCSNIYGKKGLISLIYKKRVTVHKKITNLIW